MHFTKVQIKHSSIVAYTVAGVGTTSILEPIWNPTARGLASAEALIDTSLSRPLETVEEEAFGEKEKEEE